MFIDKNGIKRKPIAYLADFEMFLPNYEETVKYWKSVCDKYGIIGLFPLDNQTETQNTNYENEDQFLKAVYQCDINSMEQADMVIAQLDGFRGDSPDSGTAFEAGYCIASNKPVYGFYTKQNMIDRLQDNKYGIEDKQYPMDNMFTLVKIGHSFEEACQLARKDFDQQLIEHGYQPYIIK